MGEKHKISQYRERLDKALASHDLADEERLKTLVKNQIIRSARSELKEHIDGVVDNRAREVSNFLGMLKSASVSDGDSSKTRESHSDWKVKQDTQECRVMYREGPEGTPYHSLLVEGYIEGPIDICLCISMESNLYKKWWPQSTIPTFKIVATECLQKVGIGEQISLVRMKVPWPLSAREALVHFFVFEYFEDDLVVVLMNSISDLESIDTSTHGFNRDGLPDTQDVVRVDVVGGFALQKVTANRSYFRTIANMDVKMDFVPPAFINFISRQLIGSGFKLYQKEVASVSRGDEDFSKALKEPLYSKIREALYSDNKMILEPKELKSDIYVPPADHAMETVHAEGGNMDNTVLPNGHASSFEPQAAVIKEKKARAEIEEIEEEECEQSRSLEEDSKEPYNSSTHQTVEKFSVNYEKKNVIISSEVDQALGILEKVISVFREYGFNPKTRSLPGFTDGKFPNLEKDAEEVKSADHNQICSNGGNYVGRTSHEPRNSSCSHASRLTTSNYCAREATHNRIAPASMEDLQNPIEVHQTGLRSSTDPATEAATSEKTNNGDKPVTFEANNTNEITLTKRISKKMRFCCLHFLSGQVMT